MPLLSSKTKILLSFLLLALFWGGSFVAIKAVTTELNAWFGAGLRMLIASFVLAAILKVKRQKLLVSDWQTRLGLWITGVFGMAMPFCLLFWAEKSISAGLAGLLNASVPIWLALLILLLRPTHESKEMSVKSMLAVLMGFFGVFVIFQPTLGMGDSSYLWGAIAAAGAAFCYAIANLLTKKFLRRSDVSLGQNLFEQHLAAVGFLFVGAFFTNGIDWGSFFGLPVVWLSLLYLGACSTALALLMYFFLLREVGAVKASIVTYLMPVTALILDYLIYESVPHFQEIAGATIVLLSVGLLKSKATRVEVTTRPSLISRQNKRKSVPKNKAA